MSDYLALDLPSLREYLDKNMITYTEAIMDLIEFMGDGNINSILNKLDIIFGYRSEQEYRLLLEETKNMSIEISLYLENKIRHITLSDFWTYTPYSPNLRSKYRIISSDDVDRVIFDYNDVKDNYKLNLIAYRIMSYETLKEYLNSEENSQDFEGHIDILNMTCEHCMRKVYYPECAVRIPMRHTNPYGIFCRYACAYDYANREDFEESSKTMLKDLFNLDYEVLTPNTIPGAVYDNFYDFIE